MCRAASVVLGQPRALVQDDIPRLSALPLHERTGISPSEVAKGNVNQSLYMFMGVCLKKNQNIPLALLVQNFPV